VGRSVFGAWANVHMGGVAADAAQMKRGGGCDAMPARDTPASGPRRPRSLPPTPGGSVRRSTRPPWYPPRGDVSSLSSPAVDGSGAAAAASGGAGQDLRVVTPALAVPPPPQVPQNPFDTLPDEMVIAVFKWVARRDPKVMLTVVHAVCQRWRRLCGDTQCVRFNFSFLRLSAKLRKPPLDAVAEVAMVVSLEGLARRFKHVVECNLQGVMKHDSADSYAIALIQHCPQLTDINFSNSWLTHSSVVALVKHSPHLTKVDLQWCEKLTDTSVVALAEHFPRLTSVDFSCCIKLTDTSVMALAEHCPRLTSVCLIHVPRLTDVSAVALAKRCPHLTGIKFRHCTRLTDTSLVALAEHCPLLKRVDFYSCNQLTDASVITLAEHCHELTRVEFRHCVLLTDASFVSLVERCRRALFVNNTLIRQNEVWQRWLE
jgi:hypothetical protein